MAKENAKKAGKKVEKNAEKAEKATEREFKYGVEDLAEKLGIKAASVRVQLRNKGIEKAGKAYGWNSKSELQEVVDALKADDEEKPAKKAKADKAPKKGAKEEKPAKADKKAKKGKKSDDE